MQLLGLLRIEAFKQTHADSRGALDVWQAELEKARWKESLDIRMQYVNASFEAGNGLVFKITTPTTKVFIKTKIRNGIVLVEWLGTEAEQARTGPLAGADKADGKGNPK